MSLELCSNARCPLNSQCGRATDLFAALTNEAGITQKHIAIKHFHPVGSGMAFSCREFLQRSNRVGVYDRK